MKSYRLILPVALAIITAACGKVICDIVPEQTGGHPQLVNFSATITLDGDAAATRSLSGPDGNNNIQAEWATGEQVALIYQNGITIVDGKMVPVINGVTLIYPYSAVLSSGGNIGQLRSDLWANQTGTLADISQYRDLRRGSDFLIIDNDNNTATLSNAVTMSHQAAIWKLTLNPGIDHSHPLKVCDFDNNTLLAAVTPASETNEVYVALPAAEKKTYRFYIESGSKRYFKKGKAQLEAGKFYQTVLTLTEQEVNIDNLIPEDIGKVIGADGVIYANAGAAGNAGTTAVAMICTVDYNGHGLAIELNGSPEQIMFNPNAGQDKTAVAGRGWHLPSKDEWESMVESCGGAKGFITKYDGTGVELYLPKGQFSNRGPTQFWTSTRKQDALEAYTVSFSVAFGKYSYGFNSYVLSHSGIIYYHLSGLAF